MLNWLVEEKRITPHIPVIDKSKREDGTFSREDFRYDEATDTYVCPMSWYQRWQGSRGSPLRKFADFCNTICHEPTWINRLAS
jgi:hypothetical protein